MTEKLYPESKIELTPVIARHYDRILNMISFGKYGNFLNKAIDDIEINRDDHILDLGCGTGKNAALMADHLGEEGRITGIDLSDDMAKQFKKMHQDDPRIDFQKQRIDVPFELEKKYNIVFLSFVIHGFPQDVRDRILENAKKHLEPGGRLVFLDWSEFDMNKMPSHHRFVFKKVECLYAFDFIEKDWKEILSNLGFSSFSEKLYFRGYARLLNSIKQ